MGDKFIDVWERRYHIHPVVMKDWVNNDWAKGRNQYLTFHIRVKNRTLIKKIIDVQNKLSNILCFDPFPKDYFHITVKECGFLVKIKKYEDDVLVSDLQKIISKAKETLQAFNRFDIFLSKLNIFSDVVFIEVYDDGKIGELNKELQAVDEVKKMKFDYPDFLPHLSIAQFKDNQDFARLISCLEKMRDVEFGTLTVSSIELTIAHLYKKYPKLETICTFNLK